MKLLLAIAIAALPALAQYQPPAGGGSGTGTVTSVSLACPASGPVTTTGTLTFSEPVNAQTGASYAILTGDCGKVITGTNAGAQAYSIAQAGTAGFAAGYFVDLRAAGAGTITVTPATSTINGAATLVLTTGQSARIISDGTNYVALTGASSGTGLTVGSTTISGGTNTRIEFNNAGVVGEYSISGTGNVCMTTSCTMVTPALGTPASGVLTNATGLPISTGVSGLGTGIATALAVNTGSAGAPVLFNGALGTPASGTLTNATGLPVAGLSNLGTGCGTWLVTPSSANLAACVTDESGTGALIFADQPAFTTSGTLTNNLAANTSGDGWVLQNSTAATSGNQRYSPRLHFIGQGWKTTATAASQTVDWIVENEPVQGSTSPSSNLVFKYATNGGGYTSGPYFNPSGIVLPNGAYQGLSLSFAGDTNTGLLYVNSKLTVETGSAYGASFGGLTFYLESGGAIAFSTTSDPSTGTVDLGISKISAGLLAVGNGSAASVTGSVRAASFQASGGTKFTISGCSAGTTAGGATAGTFASGTSGACTVVITMNGATGLTAPTGWSCAASDLTTPANLISQSASSTTTCTITGTTVSGDTIAFHAIAF